MPDGWETRPSAGEPIEFVIGMRWPHLWRLAAQPWVSISFARMLVPRSLEDVRRTRFSVRPSGPVVVQRWASRAEVDRWARDRSRAHAGAWTRFRREIGATADWGVWHEVGPR
jgi:hypothetical protein